MTLINLDTSSSEPHHSLGALSAHTTDDGSLSLRNAKFNESFHCSEGALKEAKEKFLLPAEINRFKGLKKISILDVCFGLGYNSACLFEELLKTPFELAWWGLEIDQRPLDIALLSPLFRSSWSKEVLEILQSIQFCNKFNYQRINGEIIWGDAKKKLKDIPNDLKFDLIFHDAFSPSKCPQLWTEEFLKTLSQKLAPNGRIITYSSSAAIRSSFRRAGLQVTSIKPNNRKKQNWSAGTVGILIENNHQGDSNLISTYLRPLSDMEEEHLLTAAAVPYRDPKGDRSPKDILNRRKEEQISSNLTSSSSWRRRWRKAQ